MRPSYGSILVPLYEEDGLRMGEIAQRASLSKQTLTTLARQVEQDGLVVRRPDPVDGRASLIFLAPRAHAFRPTAERVLADLDRLVETELTVPTAAALAGSLERLAQLG